MKLKLPPKSTRWLFLLLGFGASVLILWYLGPLLSLAGVTPFESPMARVIAAAVIALALVLREIFIQRADTNQEAEMARALKHIGSNALEAEIDEKVMALNRQFSEALEQLLSTYSRGKRRLRLYEIPWYLFIGPPGSGKTTALRNSGLKFPLAGQSESLSLKGIGGTRNCDWFFTDEAILIDTAGRYTSQDSHEAVDAAEWSGFMTLLKRYRPKQPINGILVALSITDLMQQTETERNQTAKSIRQRILELYRNLGVSFPVYLILTKADLIAGFNDFFADLDPDGRNQVWGATHPEFDPASTEAFLASLDETLETLLTRVSDIAVGRLQDERTLDARAQILAFPDQLALLTPALRDLLHNIFSINRYEEKIMLRGFYLTSATQEGTPIDRVMGLLSSQFGLSGNRTPIFSGLSKSYFTTRLFADVVFAEAPLTGVDKKLEKRQQIRRMAGIASVIGFTVLALGLWVTSYQRNMQLIEQYNVLAEQYEAQELKYSGQSEASIPRSSERLQVLHAAYALFSTPSLFERFGLFQGQKLGMAARHALDQELSTQFIPLIQKRLAERMAGEEGTHPEILYELLRVYLMLDLPERLQPDLVRAWIGRDWEHRYLADPTLLANLMKQLDLAMDALKSQRVRVAADSQFVSQARKKLTQVPLVTQIYLRFRDEIQSDKPLDSSLLQKLGPKAVQTFQTTNGTPLDAIKIPGIFTVEGYKQVFLPKSLDFFKSALTDNWVLGEDRQVDPSELMRFFEEFRRLYFEDYARNWESTLATIRLKPTQSMGETIARLDILSRPDNPLVELLQLIHDNTAAARFSVTPTTGDPGAKTQKLVHAATNLIGEGDALMIIEQKISQPFEELNSLVDRTDEKATAPIDELTQQLKGLHDALMILSSFSSGGKEAVKKAGERMSPGSQDAISAAKLVISRLPPPLKAWLLPLTTTGWSLMLEEAKKTLSQAFDSEIKPACKLLSGADYPLVSQSDKDLSLLDFGRVFGPSGPLEKFFSDTLQPFVEETSEGPKVIRRDDQAIPISPESIRRLFHAHQIREAFFPAGGSVPQFAFELTPLALDGRVSTFDLDLQGQQIHADGRNVERVALAWPGHSQSSPVKASFKVSDGKHVVWERPGPWAFFRLLDSSEVKRIAADLYQVTFEVQGYTARYELRAASAINPFSIAGLSKFKCPETL